MRRAANVDGGKECADCKEWKPFEAFHSDKSRATGIKPYCKECHNRRNRESKKKHAEAVLIRNRDYREKNRDWLSDRQAKMRHNLKLVLITRFGGCCVHCGFTDDRALQFDHIDGDGAQDRAGSSDWWGHLMRMKKMGDAELFARFQLLCANCNQIKRVTNSEYGQGKKSRRESGRNCRCTKGDRSDCPVHA